MLGVSCWIEWVLALGLMGCCHPVFKRAFFQRWLWGLLVLRTKRLSNCDSIYVHVGQQRCISRAVELFLFSFNMTSFLQSANGAVDGAGASIASLRDGRNRWPAYSILPRMTFESKIDANIYWLQIVFLQFTQQIVRYLLKCFVLRNDLFNHKLSILAERPFVKLILILKSIERPWF